MLKHRGASLKNGSNGRLLLLKHAQERANLRRQQEFQIIPTTSPTKTKSSGASQSSWRCSQPSSRNQRKSPECQKSRGRNEWQTSNFIRTCRTSSLPLLSRWHISLALSDGLVMLGLHQDLQDRLTPASLKTAHLTGSIRWFSHAV